MRNCHYYEITVPLKEAHLIVEQIEQEGWKVKDYTANGNGSRQINMIVSVPFGECNYFRIKYQEYM